MVKNRKQRRASSFGARKVEPAIVMPSRVTLPTQDLLDLLTERGDDFALKAKDKIIEQAASRTESNPEGSQVMCVNIPEHHALTMLDLALFSQPPSETPIVPPVLELNLPTFKKIYKLRTGKVSEETRPFTPFQINEVVYPIVKSILKTLPFN